MFGRPDFDFTKGPVLIVHQAQDGEPWRRLKPLFGKCAAVGRQRSLADVQRDSGSGSRSANHENDQMLRRDLGEPTVIKQMGGRESLDHLRSIPAVFLATEGQEPLSRQIRQ
jgi:hypothetical protein